MIRMTELQAEIERARGENKAISIFTQDGQKYLLCDQDPKFVDGCFKGAAIPWDGAGARLVETITIVAVDLGDGFIPVVNIEGTILD